MALILELRDGRGIPVWHRLETLPVTLGRALSNDIIVDDPYTDAHHARIRLDESGEIAIEDTGSVNGLRSNGSRANGKIIVRPGVEVRMGRTILRFRDVNEVVPPALVESPPASLYSPRLETTFGRSVVIGLMLAAVALVTWLGNTERSSGSSVLAAVLAAAGVSFLWAAAWGVAARGADRRFHLLGHMTMISLAILVMLGYSVLNEWLMFFFPDSTTVSVAYAGILLVVLAALIAGHLSVANALSRKRRWRAGFITSATMLALITAPEMLQEDEFSDVPTFEGRLKPVPAGVVPTSTVDEFLGAMGEAKDEVDRAIAKSRGG